jgi:putative phosphoesterase
VGSGLLVRRLGIIGDVHGEARLLKRAADALSNLDVDAIVCVGDVYSQLADTSTCCETLQERGIATVRGNHDRWFLAAAARDNTLQMSVGAAALTFLASLPATLELTTASGCTLICHGVGTNDLAHLPRTFPASYVRRALRIGLLSSRHTLVVHGHTHSYQESRHSGTQFVAVGRLDTALGTGCAVVDTVGGLISRIRY